MWYHQAGLRRDGIRYPKVDDKAVLQLLQDSFRILGLQGSIAPPSEEVPTSVLQFQLEDLSVNGTPTMAELFLTYLPDEETADDPVTPLHLYLTFPMEVPEEQLDDVTRFCMDSQVWLPKGCFCVYAEDGVVALRDTLYIRGSFDAKQIVDMAADSLEALSVAAVQCMEDLTELCEIAD